jgi:hypothetical protein
MFFEFDSAGQSSQPQEIFHADPRRVGCFSGKERMKAKTNK